MIISSHSNHLQYIGVSRHLCFFWWYTHVPRAHLEVLQFYIAIHFATQHDPSKLCLRSIIFRNKHSLSCSYTYRSWYTSSLLPSLTNSFSSYRSGNGAKVQGLEVQDTTHWLTCQCLLLPTEILFLSEVRGWGDLIDSTWVVLICVGHVPTNRNWKHLKSWLWNLYCLVSSAIL